MGGHYSSIQIKTRDRDTVKLAAVDVATKTKMKFLLGPALDGWVALYPDDSGNDEACATALASKLNGIVLHLAVHDSDIFFYNLFRDGKLVNEYCSEPDYFEEVSPEEHERLTAQPELFVFEWDALLQASERTPAPRYAVTPVPIANPLIANESHYQNYIYDLAVDEVRNRLLFCGISGVILFLNLKDGSDGILVDPPGKSPIWNLKLSPNHNLLACQCSPPAKERNEKSPRILAWNYPVLCEHAGLEF